MVFIVKEIIAIAGIVIMVYLFVIFPLYLAIYFSDGVLMNFTTWVMFKVQRIFSKHIRRVGNCTFKEWCEISREYQNEMGNFQ